jgi:hypothetical protein
VQSILNVSGTALYRIHKYFHKTGTAPPAGSHGMLHPAKLFLDIAALFFTGEQETLLQTHVWRTMPPLNGGRDVQGDDTSYALSFFE